MLTFFRPRQLPRTTEAGACLGVWSKRRTQFQSHSNWKHLHSWDPRTLRPPCPTARTCTGAIGEGGGGTPGASGECRRSKDGAKDNDCYELTVTLTRCSPCPKSHVYLHPLPVLIKMTKYTKAPTSTQALKVTQTCWHTRVYISETQVSIRLRFLLDISVYDCGHSVFILRLE